MIKTKIIDCSKWFICFQLLVGCGEEIPNKPPQKQPLCQIKTEKIIKESIEGINEECVVVTIDCFGTKGTSKICGSDKSPPKKNPLKELEQI